MKKYLSFFRLRFLMGLQYRAAAAAGVLTQFAWGFMEIMMYRAFYRADAAAFPMSFEATASYIWLQQAFLAVFAAWMLESEIFDAIKTAVWRMSFAVRSGFTICGLREARPIVCRGRH